MVRIAESTWSTYEKQEGQFDFSTVEKVLDAMEAAGISVIIGTPTYAVPSWLVKKDPSVLADVYKRQVQTHCFHKDQMPLFGDSC